MSTPQLKIIATERWNDTHESISHVYDELEQRWPVAQVIEHLDNKTIVFFTLVGGKRADIEVNGSGLRRWVQTHADGYWNNNLLALPKRRAA